MSGEAFWSFTPAEYSALAKVFSQAMEREQFHFAYLQATLHNCWLRKKGQRAFRPADFMPKKTKPQTVEEKKSVLRNMLTIAGAAFRGKDESIG